MRIASTLEEHKSELCYLLSQILTFVSAEMNLKIKHNTSQDGILELMDKHRLALVNRIINQENIKLINPFFFDNAN